MRIDWQAFDRDYPRRRLALPTYPFQRQRFWIENANSTQPGTATGLADVRHPAGHPLLGRPILSPRLTDTVYEVALGTSTPAYLSDHRVFDAPVFPATGYLEAVRAAIAKLSDGRCQIEEMAIENPLVLPETGTRIFQLILSPVSQQVNAYAFELQSLDDSGDTEARWWLHASGLARALLDDSSGFAEPQLPALKDSEWQDGLEFYRHLQASGLEYGESFRGIARLRSQGHTSEVELRLPGTLIPAEGNRAPYWLHPAFFDAGLQAVLACLPAELNSAHAIYLPVGFRQVRFHGPPRDLYSARARISQRDDRSFDAQVELLDVAGKLLVSLDGITLRPASRSVFGNVAKRQKKLLGELLYRQVWQPKPLVSSKPLAKPASIREPLNLSISNLSARADSRWNELKEQHSLSQYFDLAPQLDVLCIHYVVAALKALGWELTPGQRRRSDTLADDLKVVPAHRRMLNRVVEMLEEDGVLIREDRFWVVNSVPPTGDPASLAEHLVTQWPMCRAEISMTARCGEALASVFTGIQDPIELIFPAGSLDALEAIYHRAPFARVYNGIVEGVIAEVVATTPSHRKLRVLEIGAGTGGTTAFVLPHLPRDRTEYIYTDVSAYFLARAEERFAEYPFVQYRLLDIDEETDKESFRGDRFDIVIASNVLHATTNLRKTMLRVSKQTEPGGLLVMVEGITRQRWVDLIFGLTEGWWKFTDYELRASYPLLSVAQWRSVLMSAGFPENATAPAEENGKAIFGQMVILAKRELKKQAPAELRNRPLWLMFAHRDELTIETAARLEVAGYKCLFVRPGEAFKKLAEDEYVLPPNCEEDYVSLLRQLFNEDHTCAGISHLWSIDGADSGEAKDLTREGVDRRQETGCRSVLNLVKAMVASCVLEVPRLWLVTRGAQPGPTAAIDVGSATLLGLARVIAQEHPEFICTRIDLSAIATTSEAERLCEEFLSPDDEREIAYRGNERHVRRLDRLPERDSRALPGELVMSRHGELDSLAFQPSTRLAAGRGEVEIEVSATGLNFRDLLVALGMYPDPAAGMGGECAGTITALGPGVTGLHVGQPVMAMTARSFATYALAAESLTVPKPERLSFEEAASIPAAFLTAHYSLHTLARVGPGDSVLIHSASGGVGLAAVQLARRAGAVVFATAGTEHKRRYLASIGVDVDHVMDSRTTAFESKILNATGGRGVDVVLNSLSSDGLECSIRALAENGRFIELGKRDIWSESQFHTLRPLSQYFVIDVAKESERDSGKFGAILRELAADFETGALTILPRRTFDSEHVNAAFRLMSTAEHIGKIVVTQKAAAWRRYPTDSPALRSDGSYLITGGLGGIGLLVANWMVERGARHLLLLGHHAPSPSARETIERLRASGARISIAQCDVSIETDLAAVLNRSALQMPPLRGIIHAAGTLDDGALHRQTWSRFQAVMAAKVYGASNLHRMASHLQLDFFVLFSSAASMLGSAGQSNHAAANAFMDSLAHLRRNSGLPGLAINWGAWSQTGAAAERNVEDRMPIAGLRAISPEQGLALFEMLLDCGECQVGAFGMDWETYAVAAEAHKVESERLFNSEYARHREDLPRTLLTKKNAQASSDQLTRIKQAPASQRRTLLARFVEEHVTKALGLDPARPPDRNRPLQELGLDSLLAVELRNVLSNGLGLTRRLPSTLLFDYPSVGAITDYLSNSLLPADDEMELNKTSKPESQDELTAIVEISDKEAEAMLLKELNED
ncbi:MAG TPA: SDR family NAD(P)-dependent oxidoreductase [Terracidiphilus sp.]